MPTPGTSTEIPVTTPVRPPSNDEQPKTPIRLGVALSLGAVLWLGPYLGVVGVLLPARVAIIAPAEKAGVVALLAIVAMIVATVANIVIGAFSDLTRSRWGRRTPYLIAGSIGTAVMLVAIAHATTVTALILMWSLYQVFLNAIVAPLIAVIADRIAPRHRGTISSIYAFGYSAGLYGGLIVGAQFLGNIDLGFSVFAVLTLLSGPVAVVIMREASSRSMPKAPLTRRTLLDNFSFPRRNSRDYYLALFGKFLIMGGTFAVSGYQLYIFTDYLRLDDASTAQYVTLISTILMVTALAMAAISGPISDKLGTRKLPVIFAAAMIAIGVFFPFLAPSPWAMIIYAVIAGIGMGAFNAVDQALNVEVLPDQKTAAKDLGILNLANTGGQIIGPVIAAAAITAIGYKAIFPAAAVLAIIGAVLVAGIRKVR